MLLMHTTVRPTGDRGCPDRQHIGNRSGNPPATGAPTLAMAMTTSARLHPAGPTPAREPGDPGQAVPVTDTGLQFRVVHGYRRAFRLAGSGPPLVLVHGIGDSSATWNPVLPALARRHLVIAPDLLGHGAS